MVSGGNPDSSATHYGCHMPVPVNGDPALSSLRERATRELVDDILPFWERHAFDDDGWMPGAVLDDLTVVVEGPRHSVLAARILWTFAAAMRDLPDDAPRWEATARKAMSLVLDRFWDGDHGGVYWSLAPDGSVESDRKQVYGQAFTIYGLAQWHQVTGDPDALAHAWQAFDLLEEHARDRDFGGYREVLTREWAPLTAVALSEKDLAVPKSMNTNLHVLEAYTTLLRVTGDDRAREALASLLRASLEHIVADDPWTHCSLFFDREWRSQIATISYGHDIEASWLLWDAWEALAAAGVKDAVLAGETRRVALALADAVRLHGLDADGGVMYEGNPAGITVPHKHWWPQAEGVVGWLNAYQLAGRSVDRDSALAVWEFIDRHVIDHVHGEWFAELERDGTVRSSAPDECKIGPWKCPYHNARASLEVIRRIDA